MSLLHDNPLFIDKHTLKNIQDFAEAVQIAKPYAESITLAAKNANIIAEVSNRFTEASIYSTPAFSEIAAFVQVLRSANIQPLIRYLDQLQPHLEREPDEQEVFVESETNLIVPDTRLQIVRYLPSFPILEKILRGNIDLDGLTWREFEELVADLLSKDGYHVTLGPGRNDGGKDIIAVKEVENIGPVLAVWQAKKHGPGKKVGIEVIRELADTRNENKASKGVIVTTAYLTGPAIARVQRDKYQLAKLDRDDLTEWIRRVKQK